MSSRAPAKATKFLIDRAADQRAVADASESLVTSLDDEMVRLGRERGLD
ncbi:hypothetical protein ACQR16_28975 [Bradyrhizobium oligotrophicum]